MILRKKDLTALAFGGKLVRLATVLFLLLAGKF